MSKIRLKDMDGIRGCSPTEQTSVCAMSSFRILYEIYPLDKIDESFN
jgi:hypothetical protein